jgi:hypothetical protein
MQSTDSGNIKTPQSGSCLQNCLPLAVNLTEMAQKMAQAARAGVAIERKRLQAILAERQKKSAPASR